MSVRCSRCFGLLSGIVFSLFVSNLSAPVFAYEIGDRWLSTAIDGPTGSQGKPITLTWSFMPEGALIPNNNSGYVNNTLISFLDATLGGGPGGSDYTQRPWFSHFQESYDRLSELAGVTFVYEPNDDGVRMDGTPSSRGVLGVRGDIRLGGRTYGEGSGILAANFFPEFGGDMMINIDQGDNFGDPNNDFRVFRNIVIHETMHGLGINHVESNNANFLIEPFLDESFDGPQLDDILALQRNYGDVYEKNGGNDTSAKATPLGVLTNQPITVGGHGATSTVNRSDIKFLSIDDDSDADFFSFTIDQRSAVTLAVDPLGTTYMVGPQGGEQVEQNTKALNNLALALIGSNGVNVLQSVNANGAGLGESLNYALDPGTYYARVRGSLNDIQLYQFTLTGSPLAVGTLKWTGKTSGVWDVGGAANFDNNGAPAKFFADAAVEFDDTATTKEVTVAQNVSPFSMNVTTAGVYKFSGQGGIIKGNLTVEGSGTVELANSGNSYAGPTVVESGTLKITGNANAMVSPIEVKSGGALLLDSVDASTMKSQITVREGAELRVGTAATNANTLADVHPGIVNQGTIRVFDAEEINHVTGTGAVILEEETALLSDNLGFDGPITVRNGAGATFLNSAGFGSNFGSTTVESGGQMTFAANIAVGEPLSLEGNGGGQGALRVAANRQATLNGAIVVGPGSTRIQVESAASLAINSSVDASAAAAPVELAALTGGQLNLTNGLQSPAGLVKSGSGAAMIGGDVSLAGPVDVETGKLTLAGPNQLVSAFDVAAGATLAIAGGHTFGSAARLSGNGLVQGSFNFPGHLAPGASAGAMAVEGNLAFSGTLEIEIGGTTPMIDYDQLHIIGAGVLGGALEVSLINDFVPSLGNSFTLVTGTQSLTGAFNTLLLPSLGGGLGWQLSYLNNAVRLSVASIGLTNPADFNSDGFVNSGDLNVWRLNFSLAAGASRSQGDANGDGAVDGADFLAWQRQFASGGASVAAVPEPSAWLLALLGFAPLAGRRR